MSWEVYIKKVNQIIKDLERQGLKLGDKPNAVAMISSSNSDSNNRLHIESVARKLNNIQSLSAKYVEEALLRLKHQTEISSINEVTTVETDSAHSLSTHSNIEESAFWVNRGRFSNQRRGMKRYFPQSQIGGIHKKAFNKRYTCHNCGSDEHFIRNCPVSQVFSSPEETTVQPDSQDWSKGTKSQMNRSISF